MRNISYNIDYEANTTENIEYVYLGTNIVLTCTHIQRVKYNGFEHVLYVSLGASASD